MNVKKFFTTEEQNSIVQAIVGAEKKTSGEIRVHLEDFCNGDVLDCAAHVFKKLKMHKTDLRNGVLIYLAVGNQKFAVIGDAGINSKVPQDFWDEVKEQMAAHFKNKDFVVGLSEGISLLGTKLTQFFPIAIDDKNELSNEISFGA